MPKLDTLKSFLTPGPERVGFILKSGAIIEVQNVCEEPNEGFEIDTDDLEKHFDDIQATWHTHPNATSNLSVGDLESFRNFPDWDHYIIGEDGVTRYVVEGSDVLISS